jgi:hypothetical protein
VLKEGLEEFNTMSQVRNTHHFTARMHRQLRHFVRARPRKGLVVSAQRQAGKWRKTRTENEKSRSFGYNNNSSCITLTSSIYSADPSPCTDHGTNSAFFHMDYRANRKLRKRERGRIMFL